MMSVSSNAAASCYVHVTTYAGYKLTDPAHVHRGPWAQFVEQIVSEGHEERQEKDGPLFSFVRLKPGTGRKNANVVEVYGWVLDLDKLDADGIEAVLTALNEDRLAYVVYSTHSHTDEKWKVRVVGPLAKPVPAARWLAVWKAISKRYAPQTDQQCSDVSRAYYWPSCKPGAPRLIWSEPGDPLDPESLDVGDEAPALTPKRAVDLNAPELLTDGGVNVPRCPRGTSLFEHAETLCKTMPPAISGAGGHVSLLRVARALRWGLDLPPEQCEPLITDLYNPRCSPPWSAAEIRHKIEDAGKEFGAPYPRGALLPRSDDFTHLPLLVQNAGRFWLREPDSDDFAVTCVASDLPVVIRDLYTAGATELYTDETEPPKEKTITLHAKPVRQIIACYYQSKTTYDPELRTLVQGLRVDPKLVPGFDPDVEALLVAFAGSRIEALKQWIAACRADRLSAPARALAVVGAKGIGKSLFANGLARIWGRPPVPAKVLCERFNGALGGCPIVLADEELPKNMSGEDFRTVIQERTHSIEPKGKERHELRGCIRMVATANDLSKLYLHGGKGPDDIRAIADRLFVIEARGAEAEQAIKAAQAPLLLADGSTVDLARLAQHFMYIQQTVQPALGRFIGAPEDQSALEITLRGETQNAPELFELLSEYFEADGGWDAEYKLVGTGTVIPRRGEIIPEARRNFPVFVHEGELFVRCGVLGQLCGRDLPDVRRALKPFIQTDREIVTIAGENIAATKLAWTNLLPVLTVGIDQVERSMTTDTADRVRRKAEAE